MLGFSKTSINAPSVPNAPGAIDAVPDVTINDVTISEGDSGTTDAVFSVTLSEAYTQTVSVNYATEEGTAMSNVDYISVSDTVTFTVGITTQLVTIPIQGDYVDEIDETFTITLTNAVNGILGDPIGLGTIIDDDTAGMSIFPTSGLTTTEIGGTDSFTVALTSQPTATVTIDLISSDSGEGTVSPATLTFTDTDWNIPQTVTVTGVDDSIDDGDVPYSIQVSASSTDSGYNDLLPVDVSVTNLDDDIGPEILVAPLELTTSETGTSDEFSLVLTIQPTEIVHITLVVTDPTEGALSEEGFAFNSQNWDAPHPITVTGLDDPEFDGDVTYTIQVQARSKDTRYDDIPIDDVIVTNLDDESPILVSPLELTTSEDIFSGAHTDTFTVSLTTAPTATVTIALSSSNIDEGTVSPPSLSFTTENWATPQPVTVFGVDDPVDDGDQLYTIVTGAAVSADPTYGGLDVSNVSAINLDNDTAGITVVPLDQQTSELGDTGFFTVTLTSQPTATVTINLSSSNVDEGTVSPTSLSFTTENWDSPQPVTVTGMDDPADDGDTAYAIQFAVSSADGMYDGMVVADLGFTNIDNDTAGISVFPLDLVTSETGMTNTFTVMLTSQPTAVVTIDLSSSNTDEGTVLPVTLNFTEATWNIPQTVTVTGVDDDLADGDISYTIITDPAISDDPNYYLIDPDDVSVTNVDNEWPIVVSPLELTTSEFGDTDTFSVSLTTAPIAMVTIDISSSDLDEGRVSTNLLSFTTENWATPQQVTVTGVNDDIDDGDQTYTIITGAAVSADPNYSGLEVTNVLVTNLDDDQAGYIVLPTSGLTTSEDGDADTFTIRLTSQPRETVTISLNSSDSSEGMVSPSSLDFNHLNWTMPQLVTVSGVDDDLVDGDIGFTIYTDPAVSSDPVYHGLNPPNVSVTNLDDDQVVDTEVPTVDWLLPVDDGGQKILTNALEDQIVHLEANASDNVAIERVRFRRWDKINLTWVDIANIYNQPYQTDLNTSVLRCGFNQINVEAYDTAGNNTVEDKSGAYIWLIRTCYVYMPNIAK